jgi:serpin B
MIARSSLAALLFAAACSSSGSPTEVRSELARDTAPAVSDADLAALIGGNNQLAIDIYQQADAGNLVVSPYSISSALAMTYAGAATTSASQMASALHFTLPPAQLHAAFDQLDLDLASYASLPTAANTRPFQLHVANSLWGQHGMPLEAPFLDTLATDYDAGVYTVDFQGSPDGARQEINSWVAGQTDDLIQELIPAGDISNDTKFVITDAIYFDAGWASPFDHNRTATGTFHADGGDVQASMMQNSEGNYTYGSGAGYQAVRLPYANAPTSMIAILPTGSLADFEAGLTADSLASIIAGLQPTDLELTLPKFQLKTAVSLKGTLQALGMVAPFDPNAADLSGIDGAMDLYIGDVLHQGTIQVDEDGTIAAAATAVIGVGGAAEPALSVTFDRPFLYLIQDDTTGQILFLGRVANPSASN